MSHDEIESHLKALISKTLAVKPDVISRRTRFDADLGADPLDCVELIMLCEEEWDIHISEEEAEASYTFGRLADLIDSKKNGKRNGTSHESAPQP